MANHVTTIALLCGVVVALRLGWRFHARGDTGDAFGLLCAGCAIAMCVTATFSAIASSGGGVDGTLAIVMRWVLLLGIITPMLILARKIDRSFEAKRQAYETLCKREQQIRDARDSNEAIREWAENTGYRTGYCGKRHGRTARSVTPSLHQIGTW